MDELAAATAPAKTLGRERIELLRHSDELQRRMQALAGLEHQLPSPASETCAASPGRPWSSLSTCRR